jgi:hypothetical protein
VEVSNYQYTASYLQIIVYVCGRSERKSAGDEITSDDFESIWVCWPHWKQHVGGTQLAVHIVRITLFNPFCGGLESTWALRDRRRRLSEWTSTFRTALEFDSMDAIDRNFLLSCLRQTRVNKPEFRWTPWRQCKPPDGLIVTVLSCVLFF